MDTAAGQGGRALLAAMLARVEPWLDEYSLGGIWEKGDFGAGGRVREAGASSGRGSNVFKLAP
jgi:hypothetical protein